MNKLFTVLAASGLWFTVVAHAASADPAGASAPAPAAAHSCDSEAKARDLKGAARKAFLKECAQTGETPKTLTTQQQKMKTCNAEAKTKALKGDERKQFMKTCLSAKS